MKVIKLIIGLVLFSLLSCDTNKGTTNEIITTDEVRVVEKKLGKTPPDPIEHSIRIYIIDDSSHLHETDYYFLETLYTMQYKGLFNSLGSFLNEVVNQRFKINSKYFNVNSLHCNVDVAIMNIYLKHRIIGIMKKYCYYDKNRCEYLLINKNALQPCEINTISYFFFINRYFVNINDYANTISYSKNKLTMYK